MNKNNHNRSFVITIIVLLIISALAVLNVKAQTTPTPAPGNWSKVVIFAGSRSRESIIITDSFTCDHVEWRINWKVDTTHMHFYFTNYILQITTFPEGTINAYIDYINGSFSSIYDPANHRAGGTSYIYDNAGTFYLRIKSSPYVDSYRIMVEQNTDSPTPTPTPTISPTPSSSTEPTQSPSPTETPTATPIPTTSPPLEFSLPTEYAVIGIVAIAGIIVAILLLRRK